ncbi:TetR family transcriptional regulator [Fulvimonas yonginensis]|uniref:TetR family transcriptional regulator n=1 Tax=Fulvimonas yonginensis TaxID=1495200 RepID=A0ABU8J810_9GAMM
MSLGHPKNRADATREAILAAARAQFAEYGYDKATIRGIAAQAGIDAALVMRYYGNKEKLFATAAEFDLRLPDLAAAPRSKLGRVLADHFVNRWEHDPNLKALLRSAVSNPQAAQRCKEIFARQLSKAISQVEPDPAAVPIRAGLVASQALGVALTRYILALGPMVSMPSERLVAALAPTFQRYLAAALPGRG